MASAIDERALAERQRGEKWRKARRMAPLYVFLLFPMAAVFIFHYIPIYGVQIAFKEFQIGRGIWASPWAGFLQFEMLFSNPFFGRIMRNTVILSLLRIGFAVPAPLLLALLINEVGRMPVKRTIQSISYLPHFMSWVVLSGMLFEVLSPQRGLVALSANLFGTPAVNLFTDEAFFRPLLVTSDIWKEAGWGAIIYLAAIASIDPELYEASSIDGANRLQRAWHITIPSLVPVLTILLLLRIGNIMEAGFDQVLNLYSPPVYEVGDIIDTYEYRVGLIDRRYDFSTAVGLFKNGIGLALLLGVNVFVRRHSDYGLW